MPSVNPPEIRLNERNDLEAIIGHPPGWGLRWGMAVLAGVLALFVLIAWLVRYPDIVEAPTVLTTERPPIRIVAKASAALSQFEVSDGKPVKKGDVLAVLENPAQVEDVVKLESLLLNLTENEPTAFRSTKLPNDLTLGTLETSYAQLGKRFSELKYFLEQDLNYLKINNLRQQITELSKLNRSLERQAEILSEEIELAYSGFRRDSLLLAQNSLSRLEYEATQSAWLRARRELENLKSGTVQNDLRIRQMEAQILDLRQLSEDDESEHLLNFRNETESLLGEIQLWKNTWLLTAPIAGEVVLTGAWSPQQFVSAGEEVLTIMPTSGAGEVIGKAFLTGPGIGKLKPGMAALLRLDGYPYQEFGVLNGILESISKVPGEKGYEAQILLPEKMRTSHGKDIPFRQEMKATARIVTEERSYLERVLENFMASFGEN